MKFKVGDKVKVTRQYDETPEGRSNEIKCEGYTGELVEIKKRSDSQYPFVVKMDNGKGQWIFKRGEIEVVK